MAKAFDADVGPIRISHELGQSWKDEQEGFRFLFMGAMVGIRQFGLIEIATIGLMSRQTGAILAEVGFLLVLFAGVWLVAAQIPAFKIPTERTIVAGIALALGGLLLIIATHWGDFGRPS